MTDSSKRGTPRKKSARKPTEKPAAKTPPAAFPVVGIGASAGGLEALEEFLKKVPAQSGIAYIIIQHLDPTHKGIMPELLQRVTSMAVRQARERMKVEPDCVYVIPPNKEMSILHGRLYLFEPTTPRGQRLPIDYFFRSLADEQQQHSIGIILSGMGTDGTLGLRAIKEKAGLVVVQEPASAKFDSMPRSAIAAGLADIVAPAEELPGRIIAYLQHLPALADLPPSQLEKEKSALEKIVILLRTKTGQDFSLYKKNTLYRRIERRMGIHQFDRIAAYVRFLQENPQEVDILFKELLIGVTSFFRDPAEWDLLRDEALPALLNERPEGGLLRAWSTGCSTGEEAYSLAIIFKEALQRIKPEASFSLRIFATDLDQEAIDLARQGFYPVNIVNQVSGERLQRYFTEEEGGYRVRKEIREMVTFAPQNLIMHPPFTKLDLLLCRNLLIYLEPTLQKKLLPLFHYSLNPGGLLFLGAAETVGEFQTLFTTINPKSRLFRSRESSLRPETLAFPAIQPSVPAESAKEKKMPETSANIQALAEQLLLRDFSPPAVLATDQGDILYISGRTGKYLEPASGKVNWNLFAMARDGLRLELTNAFQKAVQQQEPVNVKGLKLGSNETEQFLNLSIQPIKMPAALRGMVMVIFRDVAPPVAPKKIAGGESQSDPSARIYELEQELRQSQEELQHSRDGMQGSKEELESTNEELQSTNEELQSTNEELTTSKEEMQSMNEELQTVNAEQVAKMDELERLNNDMQNLLNSTEIIALFLDDELKIKRFTPAAKNLFKLITGDVGRPLTDLSSKLHYPDLPDDARAVLRSLVFSEKQITASDNRWFSVRIMPYRTTDDRIDGVVMTCAEITREKQLETELHATNGKLQVLLEAQSTTVIGLSGDGRILEFNPAAEQLLQRTRDEVLGGNFLELFIPQAERATVAAELQKMLTAAPEQTWTLSVVSADQTPLTLHWSARPILADDGRATSIIAIGRDMNADT